ncbi:serine/arginine repetitive matrix protein 1 isoform X2 [Folsomia candida]|uniref:Zinc finger C2HC domain-containing protein 1C n=1 Tax=Folsomia candida TaxID=158441 RepID=A0A226ESL2_FOLCA|nr:serine/arginine repetitive matrix protein 1 isoform X2 [Folsomia candida]OXA60064.1 Zinc finger C2HC domain-containing protein 1C [Folsomia candida]
MSGRLPVSNGGNAQSQNGGAKISRMQAMQAQFQQKQMAEKETKLLAMLDNQQQRLIQHTNGVLNKYNNNQQNVNPPPLPPGKVRQMFEERRKGGFSASSVTTPKGIDKSNPLDPIVAPPPKTKPSATLSNKPAAMATNPMRKLAPSPMPVVLPSTISRPSNLGSSKKPTPPPPATSATHSSSPSPKQLTPTTSLPPSRGSGGLLPLGSSRSSSGSSTSTTRSSPTSGYPPVSNTTKYSDYASELDRREASLSNKLRGIEISAGEKKVTTTKNTSNSVRTTPSPAPVVGRPSPKPKSSPAPRPKGSPPPGMNECKVCGRFFAPDRIAKHESICKKVTTRKRKVFDPTKMRMQGTEAEPYIRIVSAKPKIAPKAAAAQGKKKVDWRKKHEDFIATIRAAKEYQAHVSKGGNPNDLPPPPPSDTSDYIKCPHCARSFSEAAAERHIPKCKNIKSNKR